MSQGDPPTYFQATGTKPGDPPRRSDSNIPPANRRSMEDESRDLPPGWVRTYDPQNSHQFFVDTTKDPPRSIWHHPYDDEEYLNTLPTAERERIHSLHHTPSKNDIISMDTDEEDHAGPSTSADLPPRPEKKNYGRRLKDKLTGTTHEQRQQERERREKEDEEAYRQHLHIRRAMTMAEQTGQPQFVGKDRYGRDLWFEPSYGMQGGYTPQGQMINPYASGIYQNPNNRFIRPSAPYNRPYGYGYGGGYGLPLMGGLVGGAMLGGLLF
ncbi:MAG: hypothetical protein GOMPHAMPRED_003385 [Gomphillus americanus]|uniref:WW domain-containing protein n=1 Tax=Gomphillus americanus TaxID=1940652 RepID=A0A8H3EN04_9LECA|nr:MAG: hypothetical protein GOMPHAMPRED_003385 [Gomphillus americanus]